MLLGLRTQHSVHYIVYFFVCLKFPEFKAKKKTGNLLGHTGQFTSVTVMPPTMLTFHNSLL